jgi:glycosyltransferase involved in cell wall biosynthesis
MNLLMIGGDNALARGIHNTQYQMLRRFSRHWERIDILSTGGDGAEPRTIHQNVHIHPSPLPRWGYPRHIVERGRALLDERPYALVVSHDFGFFYTGISAWWMLRGSAIPMVSEVHHVEGYPIAVTFRERLYRLAAWFYIPWMSRHVAAIRAVNHHEIPAYLRGLGVPEAKILVLPSLYLDFEQLHPIPEIAPEYDVLFVGRLVSNKGLFTILDALKIVKEKFPAVRLGIRGEGPLRRDLETRASDLGIAENVTFIPRLDNPDEIARLYNSAKMLVCASTAEGGPRVTAEAMACGVPVISTPVGIMPELIEDGVSGMLFQWRSMELTQKIRALLSDETLRHQIAERGRAAVQPFKADDIIRSYAEGYHKLVDQLHGTHDS